MIFTQVTSILGATGTACEIADIYRVGRQSVDRPRTLILKLSSVADKADILKNSRKLKHLPDLDARRNVIIKPDLTKMQQKENKELQMELKRRRSLGESVIIRSGKIISVGFGVDAGAGAVSGGAAATRGDAARIAAAAAHRPGAVDGASGNSPGSGGSTGNGFGTGAASAARGGVVNGSGDKGSASTN